MIVDSTSYSLILPSMWDKVLRIKVQTYLKLVFEANLVQMKINSSFLSHVNSASYFRNICVSNPQLYFTELYIWDMDSLILLHKLLRDTENDTLSEGGQYHYKNNDKIFCVNCHQHATSSFETQKLQLSKQRERHIYHNMISFIKYSYKRFMSTPLLTWKTDYEFRLP